MAYKRQTEVKGMRHRTFYVEEPERLTLSKGKLRDDIVKISDRDDLIADLFKLNFLTISALKSVYGAVDKRKIDKSTRDLLDYAFTKYTDTETILDLYLSEDDTSFIDRLLDRQAKITKVVKGVKHGK